MLTVVELNSFKKAVKKILSEESIEDLKIFLSENPTAGDMVRGTGGLRKIRWSLDNNKGKSGGSRVIYYYQNENKPLYLVFAYSKSEKENLTKNEMNIFAKLTDELKKL